jgi:hypothetical protein
MAKTQQAFNGLIWNLKLQPIDKKIFTSERGAT